MWFELRRKVQTLQAADRIEAGRPCQDCPREWAAIGARIMEAALLATVVELGLVGAGGRLGEPDDAAIRAGDWTDR
ncbi:MAG: hypothetical protein ACE5K7_04640 [Phycisphaerae bacterium]